VGVLNRCVDYPDYIMVGFKAVGFLLIGVPALILFSPFLALGWLLERVTPTVFVWLLDADDEGSRGKGPSL